MKRTAEIPLWCQKGATPPINSTGNKIPYFNKEKEKLPDIWDSTFQTSSFWWGFGILFILFWGVGDL